MGVLSKIWSWVKSVLVSFFTALEKEPADTELQDVSNVEPVQAPVADVDPSTDAPAQDAVVPDATVAPTTDVPAQTNTTQQ